MASPFDSMQSSMFGTVKKFFGHPAIWTPSTGGASLSSTVLFKNPTEELRLAGVEYDPTEWAMEYYHTDFPGLKELVDLRDSSEVVTISEVQYYVKSVDTDFDGNTHRASLQPVT